MTRAVRLSLLSAAAFGGLLLLPLTPGKAFPLHDHLWRLAAIWFVLIMWISGWLGRRGLSDPTRYTFALAICAMPVSIGVAWRELFIDHLSCYACVAAAFLSLAVLGLSVRGPFSGSSARLGWIRDDLRSVGLKFGMFSVVALAVFGYGAISAIDTLRLQTWLDRQPRVAIRESVTHIGVVPAVRVVVFSNHECADCKQRHKDYDQVLASLQESLGSRMRVDRIEIPFDSKCNSMVPAAKSVYPSGCEVALAWRAASELGIGHDVDEALYAETQPITDSMVSSLIERFGLGTEISSRHSLLMSLLSDGIETARDINLQFVPAYYVNGILATDWSNSDLERVITTELRR